VRNGHYVTINISNLTTISFGTTPLSSIPKYRVKLLFTLYFNKFNSSSYIFDYFTDNKKPRNGEAGLKFGQLKLLNYLIARFLIDKAISAIANVMMVDGSGTGVDTRSAISRT